MHLLIFFVFTAFTINGIYSYSYVGCFKQPPRKEVRKEYYETFPNKLTIHLCINHCAGKSFPYAGLEYMHECHCFAKKPDSNLVADESECNMKCDGNCKQHCGGDHRRSVYSIGDEPSQNYLGCYVDGSRESRLLAEGSKRFQGTLTPNKCIDYCKGKGFNYAGLENRFECYCSNVRPSFKSSTIDSDCDMKCDGDKNKTCGGSLRLSVYETKEMEVNSVEDNYLGCYLDIRANVRTTGKHKNFTHTLTPEICVGFCYRNGYRYAAVQNGNQCFCGDNSNVNFVKLLNSQCNIKCLNSKLMCGGHWKNAVYRTDIPDHSEADKVIGCFIDKPNRILSAVKMLFKEKCTPKLCLNVCLQLGYKYSGVEAGYHCFCGNRKPDESGLVPGNQCLTPCTGDSQKTCGGAWRILVYSTKV